MGIIIQWPDGATISASTWEEMESKIADHQPIQRNRFLNRLMFRQRAKVWSNTNIGLFVCGFGSSERFVKELEKAKILKVTEENVCA